VEAMNKAADRIRDGMSVVIFPEGSRSPDGTIQPFKKGGFTLAIKSKVPIVPLALTGSREIMPKERLTAASGEIRIRMGHPIETIQHSMKDRKVLMEKVRETILENFRLISGEKTRRTRGEDSIKEKLKREIVGILLVALGIFLFCEFGDLRPRGSLSFLLFLFKG